MLQDVWSIPFHGLELSLDFGGIEVFFHHFVFPAAAIAGAALALQGPEAGARRPAGQLPTLINWTGVVAFTIGIIIYGF